MKNSLNCCRWLWMLLGVFSWLLLVILEIIILVFGCFLPPQKIEKNPMAGVENKS